MHFMCLRPSLTLFNSSHLSWFLCLPHSRAMAEVQDWVYVRGCIFWGVSSHKVRIESSCYCKMKQNYALPSGDVLTGLMCSVLINTHIHAHSCALVQIYMSKNCAWSLPQLQLGGRIITVLMACFLNDVVIHGT